MKCIRGSLRNARELLFLTAAQTSIPLSRASSTMKLPMNPLAPVINILSMTLFCVIRQAKRYRVHKYINNVNLPKMPPSFRTAQPKRC